MSTFLGLLSGGRPTHRYDTYYFDGLGATTTKKAPAKKAPAKKAPKGKASAKPRGKATPSTKTVVKVKVKGGLRHAPIDRHHNPFKRSNIRPGGPAKRETQRSDTWSCEWRPGGVNDEGNAYTAQLCTAVGRTKKDGSPVTKLIKVNKKYKANYNKAYHKHLKEIGKPKFAKNEKDDLYSYRETEWQKANKPKGRKKPAPKKKAAAKKSTPAKKSRAKAKA